MSTTAPSHPKTRRGPKAVKVPVATESQEQVAFIHWFRLQFPKMLIFSIPNGAYLAGTPGQRAAQMARLKAEGLVKGIPDLFIPEARIWIEFKRTKGGVVSEAQNTRVNHLRAMGYTVIVAYGAEDARIKLKALADPAYVGPL